MIALLLYNRKIGRYRVSRGFALLHLSEILTFTLNLHAS